MAFTITKITAFIVVDSKQEEGVMSWYDPRTKTVMSLVCADEARIKSLYPMAVMVSKATGVDFKIIQFSQREDVTEQITNQYGD